MTINSYPQLDIIFLSETGPSPRLLHGKCARKISIYDLSSIRKLTRSLRSLVLFLIRINCVYFIGTEICSCNLVDKLHNWGDQKCNKYSI